MKSLVLCLHGLGVCSNGKKKTTMMRSSGKEQWKKKTTVKVYTLK